MTIANGNACGKAKLMNLLTQVEWIFDKKKSEITLSTGSDINIDWAFGSRIFLHSTKFQNIISDNQE